MKVWRYMELERIQHLLNEGRLLLAHLIYFTEKRDGSCLAVWRKFETGKIARLKELVYRKKFWKLMVSSRNQEEAEQDIRNAFLHSGDEVNVIRFLMDNPYHTVFGELLRTGKDGKPALSPTRIELHEKDEYIVFDIFDGTHFLNYQQVHQICFHYGMKCVRLFGEGRFVTMEALYNYRDEMLKLCKEEKREGVVLKAFTNEGEPMYAKEKLDTAKSRGQPKLEKGRPVYPSLPLSEAMGAVDKAYADLGDGFSIKSKAMPLVALYIKKEMEKHMCSAPEYDFYRLYCDYCKDHHIEQKEDKHIVMQVKVTSENRVIAFFKRVLNRK
jgi:hypothetical protein